ncbi:MAG: hypothetical protein Q9157_003291 [Trypethelium eluteriae]
MSGNDKDHRGMGPWLDDMIHKATKGPLLSINDAGGEETADDFLYDNVHAFDVLITELEGYQMAHSRHEHTEASFYDPSDSIGPGKPGDPPSGSVDPWQPPKAQFEAMDSH